MKKIICMLFFCFFVCGSFADGLSTGKTVELSIPFTIFTGVLSDNNGISDSDKGKMLDKYVEISGPYGVKPLSVQDIIDVCNAGGIINVDDCYTKIVNPVITKMRSIRFANVCNGNKTGGNQYCIDDVFAKGYVILGREEKSGAGYNPRTDDLAGGDRYYTYQSVVRPSSNEFAQDVEISEYPAFGFAWEYAKKNGHDVVCSPEVNDNFINCATRDNTHFYTFKFADTHNTKDSVITKNLTKGLCALMDSEFIDKGFDSITSDGAMGLDININSDYGCVMSDCYDLNQIAVKFGLSTERKTVKVNGKSENICAIHGLELVGANVVNTYPGYEYMSYAFREIQTVMEPSLINILNAYIKAQGINVTSFTCDYNPIKWRDESKIAGTSVSVSDDNLLRCQLNGKSVDFVFDDLFESKMSARIIGDTGMKCLLVNREKGGTASFDGKYCKGPNESQCVELGKKISGGTRWDAGAGACLLKDAAAVKTLNTTLTIAGGAAFAIGVTVLSGGTMAMVLLEAGGSVLLDLSFEGINRFYETRPNKLATEYVQSLQKCGLVGGDDARMCMNKQCIKDVVGKYIASIDGIIGDGVDALNDDQLQVFESVNERVNNCLTDLEIQSAVKNSAVIGKDKFVSHASMTLIIGGLLISPSNAVKKLSYLPKTSRILQRAGIKPIERISSTLGNARYHRIYVQDLNMNDIRKMAEELQTKGFYVSSNMDDKSKQFIAFSDEDIFKPWIYKSGDFLSPFSQYAAMADNFSGTMNGHVVYLEELPVVGGGTSKIVDIGGRTVVVVNIDGHRLPFYVSSGMTGKDAKGIPSGVWYPIAGIGEVKSGWFNKMPNMNENPVAELDYIANRLQRNMDGPTFKQLGLSGDVLPKASEPDVYRIINSEFPNGVVPELKQRPDGSYYMPSGYRSLYNANIQHIKNIFK